MRAIFGFLPQTLFSLSAALYGLFVLSNLCTISFIYGIYQLISHKKPKSKLSLIWDSDSIRKTLMAGLQPVSLYVQRHPSRLWRGWLHSSLHAELCMITFYFPLLGVCRSFSCSLLCVQLDKIMHGRKWTGFQSLTSAVSELGSGLLLITGGLVK